MVYSSDLRADTADTLPTGELQDTAVKEDLRGTRIDQAKESQTYFKKKEQAAGEKKEEFSLSHGGWLGETYRYYKNLDNQKSLPDYLKWSWTQEVYLWLYLAYKETYKLYIQGGNAYVDRGTGAAYTGVGADNEGPFLSMAYAKMNLQPEHDVPLTLTLGRQYLFLGRGLAYEAIHDGLLAEVTQYPFYVKQFTAITTPRQDNIDYSVPGFEKNGERLFIGAEASYVGIKKTSVYAFALLQKDNSTPQPQSPTQDFHYDSRYYGTGFTTTFWFMCERNPVCRLPFQSRLSRQPRQWVLRLKQSICKTS